MRAGHKLFHMYENTASMDADDCQAISMEFNAPPLRLDARAMTPCRRNRFYWLNFQPAPLPIAQVGATLQAALDVCSQAEAVFEKAYCIRSFGGYNYDGYGEEDALRNPGGMNPVRVRRGGVQFRDLDIEEKACCLGFPLGYMKNGQGTHSKRHKLIGQTFSVQVIRHLLEPLRQCFPSVAPSCIAACPPPSGLVEQLAQTTTNRRQI